MANPYEGIDQSLMGEVQNLDIDPTKVAQTVTNTVNNLTDGTLIASNQPSTSTETEETYPIKVDTYAKRKQRNEERSAWRKLPEGDERTNAANKWAMKYHGMPYSAYEEKKKERKFRSILQLFRIKFCTFWSKKSRTDDVHSGRRT